MLRPGIYTIWKPESPWAVEVERSETSTMGPDGF